MAKGSCCHVQQNRGPLNCTAADRAAVLQNSYSLLQSLTLSVVCMGHQDLVGSVDAEGFKMIVM